MSKGIIYEYEDGGRYCGEWESEHAHGYGVCTGPRGAGLFEGTWEHGQQTSGVYTWPSGQKYMGRWKQGLREGTGKETKPDGTEYSGEFTLDSRGPYGVLTLANGAVYSGNWGNGVQQGEGVETYTDGGVYRGQYKSGQRHGYGTRSSSAYELHGSATTSVTPPPLAKLKSGASRLLNSPQSVTPSGSFASLPEQAQETPDSSAQLYEGEWREDKRHGYGVLKIPGYYTYYGEWDSNTRCGHGVMVYSNGRKEEGHWQSGKLVDVLKRKKLPVSLHKHSFESKVKSAHTLALQAADRARDKAMLAESRAQVAGTKARSAIKTAQQSLADAKTARDRSDMYKNAPRVSECLKSPIQERPLDFPAVDPNQHQLERFLPGSNSLDLLAVKKDMKPSSSCENIVDVLEQTTPRNDSETSLVSSEKSEDSLSRSVDLELKRSRFSQQSSSSLGSKSSMEKESFDSSDLASYAWRQRREQLLELGRTEPIFPDQKEAGMPPRRSSDTNLGAAHDRPAGARRWSVEDLEQDEGVVMAPGRRGVVRRWGLQRVDERTGELGDGSDDETSGGQRSQKKLLPLPRPLEKKSSITMDMLTQMANWNRMITYLNFALLLFLLVLILVFVMTMNYYYLVSHSTSPLAQNPASFMTPMA